MPEEFQEHTFVDWCLGAGVVCLAAAAIWILRRTARDHPVLDYRGPIARTRDGIE